MFSWFQRIERELKDINIQLARNTDNLAEHMKRTDLLEKKVESLPQKVLVLLSITSGILILTKTVFELLN